MPWLAFRARDRNFHLENVLHYITWHPEAPAGTLLAINHYPRELKSQVEQAIREAWVWLEGAALLIPHPGYQHSIMLLSRRAARLAKDADPRKSLTARRLTKDSLHHNIGEDVWALFHRGKYDRAVFEAMKAVEIAVRDCIPASE